MQMDFELLQQLAQRPLWHDGERSSKQYLLPFRSSPWRDGFFALSWKQLAERRGLLVNIPKKELALNHGFWTTNSPNTHLGPFLNAIDFLVPDGTAIISSSNGTIVDLVESNVQWGNDPIYRDRLNYLTVSTGSSEFVQYCHIAKGTVASRGLHIGSAVTEGQVLCSVGKNGQTDRDHLHFLVFRTDVHSENPFGFKSLLPRFRR